MYRWVDHTAELELYIESPTPGGVFEEALAALGELLGPAGANAEPVARELGLSAPDRAALLAAWMDELVYLAESEALIADRAESLTLEDGRLAAVVIARPGSPPHLVKGVTYHRLGFDETGGACRATVVLDV